MKYFHNPRRKSRRRGKKRRTAAQRRATAKMIAANRRRRRGGSGRKRRRRLTTKRRTSMARKRRRRAPAARRRRRSSRRRRRSGGTIRFRRVRGAVYSRNPNIVNMLTRGVMDGATVVAGKAVAGFIGTKITDMLPDTLKTGTLGPTLGKVISAVGVGFLASRFLSADRARLAVAGALAAPIEAAVKAANIPLLSEGLADDGDYYEVDMSGYPALSGYPAVAAVSGVGDTEDDYEYAYSG